MDARFWPLDDPVALWRVSGGEADVFASVVRDGQPGPRRHLWTARHGDMLPGLSTPGLALLAVPAPGARLTRVALSEAVESEGPHAIEPLVATLVRVMQPDDPVTLDRLLEPGTAVRLSRDALVGVRRQVLWVRQEAGRTYLFGAPGMEIAASTLVPLAADAWLRAAEDVRVSTSDAATSLPRGDVEAGYATLLRLFSTWLGPTLAADEARAARRRHEREAVDRDARALGLGRLASLLGDGQAVVEVEPDRLLAACRAVGDAARIAFAAPPRWSSQAGGDALVALCRSSGVRARRVALRGEWWTADSGPMLGFLEQGHQPVSLLRKGDGYHIVVPGAETAHTPVDSSAAAGLEDFAFTFYRPLPARPLHARDLIANLLPDVRSDLARVALAALASALLGLVLPVASARVVGEVIPAARPLDLAMLLVALVAVALGSALFDLTRSLALLRLQGRASASLEAAIVDRLLSLPVPFFRRFSVGDLALRASAIGSVQQKLGATAIGSLLVGLLSFVNFGLLVYYSPPLAGVAAVLMGLGMALHMLLMGNSVRHARHSQDAQGKVAGFVLQMIAGVSKLRVAGAEARAFGVWCTRFAEERALALRSGSWREAARVLAEVMPIVATTVLFAALGWLLADPEAEAMTTGDFVAFNMAFGAFFASGVTLSQTWIGCIDALPLLERARPILEAVPEGRGGAGADPGLLSGRIEASHLSFRYLPDGPLVLEDVSFSVEPGQFIAFVGPSGSGKSSTLRLLLGFETPEKGAVYYDGQDLATLDVTAVRSQQVGVVLQHSRLLAGDILTNIVGNSGRTLEEAWEAAAKAGLADDIKAMPMGMYTILPDGAGTLSGGQRQRLLIARALVRRPRILLLDEATSALDNRTQETVSRTLDLSNATRIVIAHRLSTIRKADRIHVLDRGRIVQSGSYDELVQAGGLFAQLVARQEMAG